jgi:hypothetical protein
MVSREQKIRSVLFYLSLFIFLIGLPFILSFALSYKFNPRTLKFTRAGLIALKTQPQDADIYLDGRFLNERTPATINELLPGKYNIKLVLERHYPWLGEVEVEAGKVTRLEKIILFPIRPNIKQLNIERISSFWMDEEKERIYYIDQEDNIIYKSDLEGESFKEIGGVPEMKPIPKKWKASPDKEKLLGFNLHQIAIIYLNTPDDSSAAGSPFVLDYSKHKIVDVFWHSDSYHLILITDTNIGVLEASPQTIAVNLVNLNKKNVSCFYDNSKDTLYFMDSGEGSDGKLYDNVYKLELSAKAYPFQELIKTRPSE